MSKTTPDMLKAILNNKTAPEIVINVYTLVEAVQFTLGNIKSNTGRRNSHLTQIAACREKLQQAIKPFEPWPPEEEVIS